MGELYPHPFMYRFSRRNSQLEHANEFCTIISEKSKSLEVEAVPNLIDKKYLSLLETAVKAAKQDTLGGIHPICFGAAVLFKNGEIEVAWVLKGLEYGCTVDPISLLMREICLRKNKQDKTVDIEGGRESSEPDCIVQVDQFGVAHAPFAPGRALLIEHGFDYINVLVHECNGTLSLIKGSELLPVGNTEFDLDVRSLKSEDFVTTTSAHTREHITTSCP